MTDRPADEAVAGLGHELKLLVDLIVEHSAPWLERVKAASPGMDDASGISAMRAAAQQHAEGGEHAGFNCGGWCPICAAVGVAKGQPPEFTARAFEQAAQAVALVRAVLADRWHPEEGMHMPGFEPPASDTPGDAPNATLGAPNAPNAAFTPPQQPSPNGRPKRSESPRVQRVAVRKAAADDTSDRQP